MTKIWLQNLACCMCLTTKMMSEKDLTNIPTNADNVVWKKYFSSFYFHPEDTFSWHVLWTLVQGFFEFFNLKNHGPAIFQRVWILTCKNYIYGKFGPLRGQSVPGKIHSHAASMDSVCVWLLVHSFVHSSNAYRLQSFMLLTIFFLSHLLSKYKTVMQEFNL